MYILVYDRRVRKHKKHLVTIERDEKSKFLFYNTIHMLHWDEEGGGRWVEGGLTYNVSYKADDTSGIAFQAVRLNL